MQINTSNNPLEAPKRVTERAPSEEARETQRKKAEETRNAETREPRQTAAPDSEGLRINIVA